MGCRNISYRGRTLTEEHKRKVREGVKNNLPSTAYKKGQRPSIETEFKKGQASWNKGTKGIIKSWSKGKKFPEWQGANNPAWKGTNVGLSALHDWVARHKRKTQKCEHCKTTTAKKFEWANKDHKYRRILSDFILLCTRCHRKYDIKYNGYTTHGFQHK